MLLFKNDKVWNFRITNFATFLSFLVIEYMQDLDQIKGVWLKDNYKPFHVSAKLLDAMSLSLRVFAMGNNLIFSGECSKRFDERRFLQAECVLNFAIDTSKLRNLSFLDFSFKEHRIWSISEAS